MEKYIECPNSNLRFYGTKLDGNGNDCAVFGTPNGNKFLIQQVSMGFGSKGWYSGSKSTMDAETFLAKNPDITIEDLERGVVEIVRDANPSWAKRVRLYKVFDSKNSKDMKRVKDSEDLMFVVYKDGEAIADFYNEPFAISYAEEFAMDGDSEYTVIIKGGERDGEVRWSSNKVSDSRKIKDAETDVLDGILMIAFNDGSEEDGYNEVKKHANEQGELDGVQYETYDTDNQDGVTLIDLCAATDDANAFVKALLTEWGIIDAVADIEFEKSELMENAEEGGEQVSDSLKTALAKGALKLLSSKIGKWAVKEVGKYLLEKGFEKLTGKSDDDKEVYESEDGDEIEVSYKDGKLDKVSDSKVEDMTKPSHLRGYAEKYRKKRREQKESYKENEEEKQDKEVSDSKTIKNDKDMRRVKDDADTKVYSVHYSFRDADNWYNWSELNESTNPTYTENLKTFLDKESAEAFYDSYNENDEGEGAVEITLFESDLFDLNEFLLENDYESVDDILDNDGSVLDYAVEQISNFTELYYSDLNSKTIEGGDYNDISPDAVVVVWQWHKYIGYARTFKRIAYAYQEGIETEKDLITGNSESTMGDNYSVIVDNADGYTDDELYQVIMEEMGDSSWKWNNNYERYVSEFCGINDIDE